MKIILAATLVAILAVSVQAGNFAIMEDRGFDTVSIVTTVLGVTFVLFFVLPVVVPLILVSFKVFLVPFLKFLFIIGVPIYWNNYFGNY